MNINEEDFTELSPAMKAAKRWLLWKSIKNKDATKKDIKQPFYTNGTPRQGKLDSEQDINNLDTFENAVKALSGTYTGLGFALGKDEKDNYWQGIDFDGLSKHQNLGFMAEELKGYVEHSPSGDGVHAIGYGRDFKSLGSNGTGIEAYSSGRYFTVTGQCSSLGDVECLADYIETVLTPIHHKPVMLKDSDNVANVAITQSIIADLRSALCAIDCNDRDLWVSIGHALKTIGNEGRSLWLEWSMRGAFNPETDYKTWESFDPVATNYKKVFDVAQKQFNWINPAKKIINFTRKESEAESHASEVNETDAINDKYTITAYPGAMQLLVDETLRTANKKQPELSILSALIGMTAAIGGNYKGPDGSRFNLYGVGFAGTGEGKDKPMLSAVLTSSKAGTTIGGKPASGAAVEDLLDEQDSKVLLNIDEIAHSIGEMNDPKNGNMRNLSENLLKLFSASRSTYYTRALARSNNTGQRACVNPVVSLLGFACPDELGKAFGNGGNVNDGFMGRVLWANGRPNPKHLRSRGEFSLPEHVKNVCIALSHTRLTQVSIDSEADLLLDDLIEEFELIGKASTNPFEEDLKKRSFEKTERIAGVLAIWDDPVDPVIMPCHVEWAANFVRYSDYTVLCFVETHMHGGETQANAARVMAIIDKFNKGKLKATNKPHKKILKEGYYPRSVLLKYSHLAKKDFDTAVEHLIALESMESGTFKVGESEYKVVAVTS